MDFVDVNDCVGGKKTLTNYPVKSHDRSHWYLSNAEVQVNTVRLPIWQNSKVFLKKKEIELCSTLSYVFV